MNNNQRIGKLGEDAAICFLKKKEYKLIKRNYRCKWGEIDIIAQAADKTLVFCEVKTLKSKKWGLLPEMQVNSLKLKKLRKTASIYANRSPLIDEEKGWRIDLIAVDLEGDRVKDIRHYLNIG